MPPDESEPLPAYTGPYVVIRPDGLDYIVGIEAATGEGAARDLWTTNGLPCLDLTVGGTARPQKE